MNKKIPAFGLVFFLAINVNAIYAQDTAKMSVAKNAQDGAKTSVIHAQEPSKVPVGGMYEAELENLEKSGSLSKSLLPSILRTELLNKYYSNWDTLHVRYVAPEEEYAEDVRLPLLISDSAKFVMPVKGEFVSPYGWRRLTYRVTRKVKGKRRVYRRTQSHLHAGVDLKLNKGDDVYASFDGVVRMARYYAGYGNCVVIRHFNGLETLYAHLSKIEVEVNQSVKAGDIIGLGGSTGRSTGNHLHFETRFQGRPFNPKQIIDFGQYELASNTIYIDKSTFGKSRDYMPKERDENEDLLASQEVAGKEYAQTALDNQLIDENGGDIVVEDKTTEHKELSEIANAIEKNKEQQETAENTVTLSDEKITEKKTTSKKLPSSKKNSVYKVKKGDNLHKIAEKNNITLKKLCNLNGISAKKTIQPGTKLKIK